MLSACVPYFARWQFCQTWIESSNCLPLLTLRSTHAQSARRLPSSNDEDGDPSFVKYVYMKSAAAAVAEAASSASQRCSCIISASQQASVNMATDEMPESALCLQVDLLTNPIIRNHVRGRYKSYPKRCGSHLYSNFSNFNSFCICVTEVVLSPSTIIPQLHFAELLVFRCLLICNCVYRVTVIKRWWTYILV